LEHQELQRIIWGYDPRDVIPARLLITLARHGGIVLGAYVESVMIGLLMSVQAEHQGQRAHLSYMAGVHPSWRGRGVGAALKWRQRELVLAQGIEQIIWTYDPLEAVNARLNLAKLAGIARGYTEDYYGAMDDSLNRGFPSDRFLVEWHLNATRVRNRAVTGGTGHGAQDREDTPIALGSVVGSGGMRVPTNYVQPTSAAALVEIPAEIQVLKRNSPEAAMAWRYATREAFTGLFAGGYGASDVISRNGRVFYRVEKPLCLD
jgi:predicted GNAT superfamily acetyltransferase